MESFNRLGIEALLVFDLILGIAMSVILFVTRQGLGTAARRVDVWLVGSLLLLTARLVDEFGPDLFVSTRPLVVPLILAGLFWQAEGMRALKKGHSRARHALAASIALAVFAAVVQSRFHERGLPFVFAAVSLLLVRNAVSLSRDFWGARLLAVASLVLLIFNALEITVADHSPGVIYRRGLILEMVWALFSTAGFLQCLYQDIRDRLAITAMTDALTGALNRTGLMPLLRRDIEQARRGGDLSVVLCDLDHFKSINDKLGHPAGDKVLQRFVSLAKSSLRSTDLLGRWGGEEFLIVLPRSPLEEATAVARRVQQAIAQSEAAPKFTFSAGIACASEGRVQYDLEQLLAVADQRLYVAKRVRDTVVCEDETDPKGGAGADRKILTPAHDPNPAPRTPAPALD